MSWSALQHRGTTVSMQLTTNAILARPQQQGITRAKRKRPFGKEEDDAWHRLLHHLPVPIQLGLTDVPFRRRDACADLEVCHKRCLASAGRALEADHL